MVAIANVSRFIMAATRCSSAYCSLILHLARVASSRSPVGPPFAERALWNIARDRLHWLDVGRDNHLAPFLGFVGDEFAEIGGRGGNDRAAHHCNAWFAFWCCH